MRKKSLLHLNVPDLIGIYKDKFPEIVQMAILSDTFGHFKRLFSVYLYQLAQSRKASILPKKRSIKQLPLHSAAKRIYEMLLIEGDRIHDIATNEEIDCNSVALLWRTLRREDVDIHPDFLLDWYYLFEQLYAKSYIAYSEVKAVNDRERWLTGIHEDVFYKRSGNRTRIYRLLVEKIEDRAPLHTRYRFTEGMSFSEKQDQVQVWWFDYQFQLIMAIRSADELNYFMGKTLSQTTMDILYKAEQKGIPFFITPYYLSLLNVNESGYDDAAIRSYVLYSAELVQEFGKIKAWEKEDDIQFEATNTVGWLLPDSHHIRRRYPEVAILIPDTGHSCAGLCAVCQRMYGFQQGQLASDFKKRLPYRGWDAQLCRLMDYFEYDSQLRDVLLTGGDVFMNSNSTLEKILGAILHMAIRKKEANLTRRPGKKYAAIQRVRLDSRMPAYLPYRINNELVGVLHDFQTRAREVGISQFIIQTHFESPLEITVEVMEAVRKIQEAGWLITNQQAFTVASSRRGHHVALRKMLNQAGVFPYYTSSVKGFAENKVSAVPTSRLMQEMKEEKIYGKLSSEEEKMLQKIALFPQQVQYDFPRFLRNRQHPFISIDRNMKNLPGVGKSLTFKTVGITSDGRRVLCFVADPYRSSHPDIENFREIYIVESKSIASYLRQLEQLGERIEDYHSVWYYNRGKTERVANIFQYPKQENGVTSELTNFKSNHTKSL